MTRFALPLLVFAALVALLAVGLNLNPREVPSPLIGKPAPAFSLPNLALAATQTDGQVSTAAWRGKVWLLNVWASWCSACRQEHSLLMDLAASRRVDIVGLNYKDKDDAARIVLRRFGNPYSENAVDADGRAGLDWGVYGVPETFVIDKKGMVRYKHIGPLNEDALRDKILPLVKQLKGESA